MSWELASPVYSPTWKPDCAHAWPVTWEAEIRKRPRTISSPRITVSFRPSINVSCSNSIPEVESTRLTKTMTVPIDPTNTHPNAQHKWASLVGVGPGMIVMTVLIQN